MRSFDWDATLAEIERQQLPIVYRGNSSSGLKFIYADARDTLGHSLEFTSVPDAVWTATRSEEHTSELQSLMRISYAVLALKKKSHKSISNNITETTTL